MSIAIQSSSEIFCKRKFMQKKSAYGSS
jgi:hypothetical protein